MLYKVFGCHNMRRLIPLGPTCEAVDDLILGARDLGSHS
jgi:hypothetical protein